MKIGIFDSGLGGLTIVKSLTKLIKGVKIFYIADTKNAPYGEKTPQQILDYSLDITKYFITTHNIDTLIIACNTATSASVEYIRDIYPYLSVIGVEPGVKPAFEISKTHKVGVLATLATLKGKKYKELSHRLLQSSDIELFEQSCVGLVEQIEKGEIYSSKTKEMLEIWLKPMREVDVDTIVLGCTHYPLVSKIIKEIMQKDIYLIETGDAIANYLLHLSQKEGHHNVGSIELNIYTTDKISKDIVKNIFGKELAIETIVL